MTSTYYVVRIHPIPAHSAVPDAVRAFMAKQSSFHQLTETDFIFAAPSSETRHLRDTIAQFLGASGTADVNAITLQSRP